MEFLNQPVVRNTMQTALKNVTVNALKLGLVAGGAVFTNNVFKTIAKNVIEQAQRDYKLIRHAINNR